MKTYIYKLIALTVVLQLAISCETTELDLQDDPTSLTEDQANPNFVLNSVLFNFAQQQGTLAAFASPIIRHTHQFGTYAANANNTAINTPWALSYQVRSNREFLEQLSTERGLSQHVAIAKIVEAYAFVNLVDFIGTAVYSEANQPGTFPNPELDKGEDIYNEMYNLLNQALVELETPSSVPLEDIFFDATTEDVSKWKKLANTLKIRMYVQTKLTNNTAAVTDINAIIASGDFISSPADDFFVQFGTQATNPDVRHPSFQNNYVTNANEYMSNGLMDLMQRNITEQDPRMKYYFYRQVLHDPDNPLVADNDWLPCNGDNNFDFCYIEDGYWGRDHCDNDGIPNDGDQRTTYGVYPAGGAIDNAGTRNDAITTFTAEYVANPDQTLEEFLLEKLTNINPKGNESTNKGGAGISPILLSSFTHFLLAEAALPTPVGLGTTGDSKALMLQGIQDSFDRVGTVAGQAVDAALTANYINAISAEYDMATTDSDRLKIIIREFYVASFGNSIEAYNAYRRTGFPDLQEPVISGAGDFPRSFFLPNSEIEANNNPNITQKSLTDRVFWDTNPAGFIK